MGEPIFFFSKARKVVQVPFGEHLTYGPHRSAGSYHGYVTVVFFISPVVDSGSLSGVDKKKALVHQLTETHHAFLVKQLQTLV